jgi:hypothetical protein
MKIFFSLSLIVILLVSCTSNLPSPPLATATVQITATIPTSEKPTWNVYDPDPNHIWNRVFRQFFSRTAKDGKEYGLGELDPLLWFDTTYLLSDPSHEQAIEVLDEFLATNAENLVDDPLKRAMFQRDLWAVFDWLAFQADTYRTQRAALKTRFAQIIQRVALTKEEILSLPDNYELTVHSGAFPTTFQEGDPEVAFLPVDLFQPNSTWVPMGREGGPIAMAHTEGFPFLGRSVFLVFIRSPNGRGTTLDFIHSLNTEQRPALTTGAGVALVRRMLLIDDQGNLVLSPLVETVQHRYYSPTQIFHKFELDRARLLKGRADTFKLKTDFFTLFSSHGDMFAFGEIYKATVPENCKACHANNPAVSDGGNARGILSYSRAIFPLPDNEQPVLGATSWDDEAQTVIQWKLNHRTWQALKFLWNR